MTEQSDTTTAAAQPLTFEEKIAKSSQVNSVTYDAHAKVMSVIFKNTPGFRYDYADFGPAKWAELQAAESIGSYLYRNVTRPIDGQLPYQFTKVTLNPQPAAQV